MIKSAIYKTFIVCCFPVMLACGKEKAVEKNKIKVTSTVAVDSVEKDTLPAITSSASPRAKYQQDCSILKEGNFTYKDVDGDIVKVTISDNVITEQHKEGKYIILSKMTWKGECEYDNMLMLCTIPDFKLPPGTVMNVVIDKVENNNVSFTATANGKSYHNTLTKL